MRDKENLVNIVVFGANGPTGKLVTANALAAGHQVTAFTRHPDAFPLAHERLRVAAGDVADPAAVADAITGTSAVLSSLGVPYGRQPITVYSEGITNIVSGMRASGVRRLICVSSSAIDPAAGPHGGFFFEKVLQPFIAGVLGRTLYDDMKRMEGIVAASDLDWTVMRPSGLFDAPAVSDYRVAERYLPQKFTARPDLADAMVAQLDDVRFLRTTAAVATVSGAPSVAQLMWREAFKKGAPRHDAPALAP
jgi:putative NADH-flavin reductase